VNGYSRPVSKRVALSLSLSLFFFLSLVIGEEKKKKGFSSFAYILVDDYMRMCMPVRTSKKPSVGGYCRQRDIYKERKRSQV
jgi:hypothetical protein